MSVRERLLKQIEVHENCRAQVYDDATGKPIGPGTVVKGTPTIGIGLACGKGHDGLYREESLLILDRRLDEREHGLRAALPWFDRLDDVRQCVLIEMAFQNGVQGLLDFKDMLAAVEAGDWVRAELEMLDSRWATQAQHERVQTLTSQMRTGQW